MLMEKANVAKKEASRKPSIERLRELPLQEITDLLARGMVKTLNAVTGNKGKPKKAMRRKVRKDSTP
jgi:hypothetical protein